MGETHLSSEALGLLRWVVLGVSGDHTTTDFLDRDILHIKTNVITREGFSERLVMHFDRLDLGSDANRSKGDYHTRF